MASAAACVSQVLTTVVTAMLYCTQLPTSILDRCLGRCYTGEPSAGQLQYLSSLVKAIQQAHVDGLDQARVHTITQSGNNWIVSPQTD